MAACLVEWTWAKTAGMFQSLNIFLPLSERRLWGSVFNNILSFSDFKRKVRSLNSHWWSNTWLWREISSISNAVALYREEVLLPPVRGFTAVASQTAWQSVTLFAQEVNAHENRGAGKSNTLYSADKSDVQTLKPGFRCSWANLR